MLGYSVSHGTPSCNSLTHDSGIFRLFPLYLAARRISAADYRCRLRTPAQDVAFYSVAAGADSVRRLSL